MKDNMISIFSLNLNIFYELITLLPILLDITGTIWFILLNQRYNSTTIWLSLRIEFDLIGESHSVISS